MTGPDCTLQLAVGRHEPCPEDACPFWRSAGCAIQELRPDIETNPELAEYLLDLRGAVSGRRRGWSIFRFLPSRGG